MSSTLHSVRRRVLALLHLSVFAFSLSTSLLPCETADARRLTHHETAASTATPAGTLHDDDAHQVTADADASSHGHLHALPPSHESSERVSPGSSHQDTHESLCPLVIGCVGMVQFSLDASWRSREALIGVETPRGVTLGRAFADRSVDSPPPRV